MERQLTVSWSYVKRDSLSSALLQVNRFVKLWSSTSHLTPIFWTWCLDSAIYGNIWISVSHMHHPSNVKPYMHFQSPRISKIITCTTQMMDNFFQCPPARGQVRGFQWYYQLRLFFLRLVCVLQSQGRIKLDTVLWRKRRQQQFRMALDFWNILFTKDIDMYLLEFIKNMSFQVYPIEKCYCGNELCYFRAHFYSNIALHELA